MAVTQFMSRSLVPRELQTATAMWLHVNHRHAGRTLASAPQLAVMGLLVSWACANLFLVFALYSVTSVDAISTGGAAAAKMVMRAQIEIGEALSGSLLIPILLGWGLLSYFVWRGTLVAVGTIYLTLYPVAADFFLINSTYDRFLSHRLRWQFRSAALVGLVVLSMIVLKLHLEDIDENRAGPLVHTLGATFMLLVPAIFGIVWANAASMGTRHRKAKDRSARRFERYLFSPDSRRMHFLGMGAILCFFALLTWVLLPLFFRVASLPSSGIAALIRNELWYDQLHAAFAGSGATTLPAPTALAERLDLLHGLFESARSVEVRDRLLMYLFITALFSGVLGLAIPSFTAAIRSLGYRRAIRSLLSKTLKSTLISSFLGLLVEYGFRLSTDRGFIWILIFSFTISFMLAHDDEPGTELAFPLGIPPQDAGT